MGCTLQKRLDLQAFICAAQLLDESILPHRIISAVLRVLQLQASSRLANRVGEEQRRGAWLP
jgi:hypothetical protein